MKKKNNLLNILLAVVVLVALAIFAPELLPTTLTNEAPVSVEAGTPIIEPQAIADYLFEHGNLPDNFITKKEAEKRGWNSGRNDLSDVAPGMSIGGDHFGNYQKVLPEKKGRTWKECDCYYKAGARNAYRICFSNDGLVYYSDDHYQSFTQLFPSATSGS